MKKTLSLLAISLLLSTSYCARKTIPEYTEEVFVSSSKLLLISDDSANYRSATIANSVESALSQNVISKAAITSLNVGSIEVDNDIISNELEADSVSVNNISGKDFQILNLYGELRTNPSDQTSVKLGEYALDEFTGTTRRHTAVGQNALRRQNNGLNHTAIGNGALGVLKQSQESTAVGYSAGGSVITASAGVFIGSNAGISFGGDFNTIVGAYSAAPGEGDNNVIIGYTAAFNGGDKDDNVIIGVGAATNLDGGINNVVVGNYSGDNVQSGDSNIIIGYDVEPSYIGASNELNIGDLITGNLSSKELNIDGDLNVGSDVEVGGDMTCASLAVTSGGIGLLGVAGGTITAPLDDLTLSSPANDVNIIVGTGREISLQGDVGVTNGDLEVGGDIIASTKTPSSASDTGTTGTITWDSDYIYICVATNTWKRVAIATW